jgi:carbonic anhydrase/acetyltransferase-like protein (isoleucine patch superfamily)
MSAGPILPERGSLEPLVLALDGWTPQVDEALFLAPGAIIVGAVTIGRGTSVWYGCVLRADGGSITVGRDVNIQDGCIMHADPGFPAVLEDRVSLGHGAIVHGAHVGEGALIGMRATVLNGARIGEGSLVAAGAVVRPGMVVPAGSMVAGVPAQVRRPVTDEEREVILSTAPTYRRLAETHLEAIRARRSSD